jgi:hypothetical protein
VGFYEVLARPFDPVLDWSLFGPAVEFLGQEIGEGGAIACVVAAVVLAVAILVLMPLSALRLTRLVVRHQTRSAPAATVLVAVCATCAVLGVQIAPGVPVYAKTTAGIALDRMLKVGASLRDREAFAAEAAVDAFRDTPGDRLLTALRGKDVLLAFIESYGRDAVEDPYFAPRVGAVLEAGDRRLQAAGFSSRSAFLTSSTAGGSSWLAHATLLCGLWVKNQQRYRTVVTSDRLTLNAAFRRAGWRTVGVMPGVRRAWPEGAFFGHDQVYAARDLGYRGPVFPLRSMPDQYTLSVFHRNELARAGRPPVMAEIPLTSSHTPFRPVPKLVDWADVGDGSIFATRKSAGAKGADRTKRVRTNYRRSVEYSLNTLISYVETHGDDNTVLVFLGDHQPSPLITGGGASRDVPITIVARDRAIFDRISTWGWQEGLKPRLDAPVWRMDAFRDRFLTAYGP